MSAVKSLRRENPVHAARPCLEDLPYRAVVFSHMSPHGTRLYAVAGSIAAASSALKALKEAHRVHGGKCFFCKKEVAADQLAVDHAEPVARGGGEDIQNLLIACKPCNAGKGHKPIELYKKDAGKEWLTAVLAQVQDRLNRL